MIRNKWKVCRAIIKSLQAGSSYHAACKAANLSWTAFYGWRTSLKTKNGKTFGDIVQQIWDSRVEHVEDAHFALAMKGNWQAQQFFLTNRKGVRWRKEPEAQFTNIFNGIKTGTADLPPMQRVYVASPNEVKE